MSKYKRIETQITEVKYIKGALEEMGIPYEENAILCDFARMSTEQRAAVVVRARHFDPDYFSKWGGVANDLGWLELEDGTFICNLDDDYIPNVRQIMEGVHQRAALFQLQELATANGFELEITEEPQRIVLGGYS